MTRCCRAIPMCESDRTCVCAGRVTAGGSS